ncbi:MAG: hypothetical protein SGBAC_001789 [Bacillariaceae sp.]
MPADKNDIGTTPTDVLFGRGIPRWRHPGNKPFKRRLRENLEAYMESNNKDKFAANFVKNMKDNGWRFLKWDRAIRACIEVTNDEAITYTKNNFFHENLRFRMARPRRQARDRSPNQSKHRQHVTTPNLPDHLLCPLTQEPFVDPVIDHEGNTYEKSAILEWLSLHPTSPLTRNHMTENQLIPNRALKHAIACWKGNSFGARC